MTACLKPRENVRSTTPFEPRQVWAVLMIVTLLLSLTACGFRPRGYNKDLSERFSATYLDYLDDPEVGLGRELKRLITYNGGAVVEPENARITVAFSPISELARQVALSGDGSFKEYERTYTTLVQVTDNETGIMLGSREIRTTRYVQEDERRILASEEQLEISKKSAAKDLAAKILRYLEQF